MGYLKHLRDCTLDCDCQTNPCDECASCPTFTVTCRSKSASKTKCGHVPFDPQSTPPKRYLTRTGSGTGTNDPGGGGTVIANIYSGAHTYARPDCAETDTRQLEITEDGVPLGSPETSVDPATFNAGCSLYYGNSLFPDGGACPTPGSTPVETTTSITWTWSGTNWSGEVATTFSSEYTTAQLLTDCETALGVASWSSFSETCLSALYSVSGDELTITLRQVEHKVTFDAPTPAGCRLEWDVYLDGVFYAHNCVNLSTGATEYTDLVFQPASPGAYTLTDWAISSAAC